MNAPRIFSHLTPQIPYKAIFRRLGYNQTHTHFSKGEREEVQGLIDEAAGITRLEGAVLRTPFRRDGECLIFPDGYIMESGQTAKLLRECREALLMGVTGGSAVMEIFKALPSYSNHGEEPLSLPVETQFRKRAFSGQGQQISSPNRASLAMQSPCRPRNACRPGEEGRLRRANLRRAGPGRIGGIGDRFEVALGKCDPLGKFPQVFNLPLDKPAKYIYLCSVSTNTYRCRPDDYATPKQRNPCPLHIAHDLRGRRLPVVPNPLPLSQKGPDFFRSSWESSGSSLPQPGDAVGRPRDRLRFQYTDL